jgi:ABC-2 type transport system ATP-binding protein
MVGRSDSRGVVERSPAGARERRGMDTGAAAITVEGLRKAYAATEALRGISFVVPAGAIVALLGPNGAGKTTTVEILEGHRRRSAGSVSVLGWDPERGGRDLRERIGIVLQSAGFDRELTVREVLRLYASFYASPRSVDEVISLLGLDEKRSARTCTLSGGQRRRLDLALALIGDPDLIFLDEPTTGFDPNARRRSWEAIERLRTLGKTILLTSHYLDEVQRLADRVVVLADGLIVAEGPPSSLGGRDVSEAEVLFRLPDGAAFTDLPEAVRGVARLDDGTVEIHTDSPTKLLYVLTAWAVARGAELTALRIVRPSLEDVYLELTRNATEQP